MECCTQVCQRYAHEASSRTGKYVQRHICQPEALVSAFVGVTFQMFLSLAPSVEVQPTFLMTDFTLEQASGTCRGLCLYVNRLLGPVGDQLLVVPMRDAGLLKPAFSPDTLQVRPDASHMITSPPELCVLSNQQ